MNFGTNLSSGGRSGSFNAPLITNGTDTPNYLVLKLFSLNFRLTIKFERIFRQGLHRGLHKVLLFLARLPVQTWIHHITVGNVHSRHAEELVSHTCNPKHVLTNAPALNDQKTQLKKVIRQPKLNAKYLVAH